MWEKEWEWHGSECRRKNGSGKGSEFGRKSMSVSRTVIKRQGLGFSPGSHEFGPRLLHRQIEET